MYILHLGVISLNIFSKRKLRLSKKHTVISYDLVLRPVFVSDTHHKANLIQSKDLFFVDYTDIFFSPFYSTSKGPHQLSAGSDVTTDKPYFNVLQTRNNARRA